MTDHPQPSYGEEISMAEQRGQTKASTMREWAALAIAIGTLIWNTAYVSKQVEQNRQDIAKLERRAEITNTTSQSIDSRLARIEATLDIITGGGGKRYEP